MFDFSPTQRKRIDGPLRRLTNGRLYYSYGLEKAERVKTVPNTLDAIAGWLTRRRYERPPRLAGIPLEAAKTHPDTGQVHDKSLRRVDPDNPTRQFHIHLFEVDGVIEVFSHMEYRPDARPVAGESFTDAYERLQEHLRPSWGQEWGNGTTYVLGAYCGVVADLVD